MKGVLCPSLKEKKKDLLFEERFQALRLIIDKTRKEWGVDCRPEKGREKGFSHGRSI